MNYKEAKTLLLNLGKRFSKKWTEDERDAFQLALRVLEEKIKADRRTSKED